MAEEAEENEVGFEERAVCLVRAAEVEAAAETPGESRRACASSVAARVKPWWLGRREVCLHSAVVLIIHGEGHMGIEYQDFVSARV